MSKEPANFIWKKMLVHLAPRNSTIHVQRSKAKTLLILSLLIAKTHSWKKKSYTFLHMIAILKTFLPSYLLCDPSLTNSKGIKHVIVMASFSLSPTSH